MLILIVEKTPLIIVDKETPRVAKSTLGSILLGNDKYLEALPAKRLYLFDGGVHIFVKVVSVHYRVNL